MAEAAGLRAERMRRIEFLPEKNTVVFRDADGMPSAEVGAEGLTALLVAYCGRSKIPLPRQSQKSVEITSRSVLLRIAAANLAAEPANGVKADLPHAMIWQKARPIL